MVPFPLLPFLIPSPHFHDSLCLLSDVSLTLTASFAASPFLCDTISYTPCSFTDIFAHVLCSVPSADGSYITTHPPSSALLRNQMAAQLFSNTAKTHFYRALQMGPDHVQNCPETAYSRCDGIHHCSQVDFCSIAEVQIAITSE